jgi:hypothetical protein
MKLTRFRGHRTFVFKEPTMAKTRPPYTPEFRRQMVELVRAGRSPEELAQEFEPTAQQENIACEPYSALKLQPKRGTPMPKIC